MSIANLLKPSVASNNPGIASYVYMAKVVDIDVFPTLLPNTTTTADDIVFNATKGFAKIECTMLKGGLASNLQGEIDSKNKANEVTFFVPRYDSDSLALIETAKNADLIVLVEDNNGNVFLVGRPSMPAKLEEANGGSGNTATDPRGIMFKVISQIFPTVVYTGAINTL